MGTYIWRSYLASWEAAEHRSIGEEHPQRQVPRASSAHMDTRERYHGCHTQGCFAGLGELDLLEIAMLQEEHQIYKCCGVD